MLLDEALNLQTYDASHEGMAKSWMERFSVGEFKEIDGFLHKLYLKDQPYFPSKEWNRWLLYPGNL